MGARASITGPAVRSLLEAFGTPQQVAAALPDDLYEAVVRKGRARRHAGRMAELQMLAANSAGLVDEIAPILAAQDWLLHQLRLVEGQIANVEEAIANALESWPLPERVIFNSLPGMTALRQAVLLSVMGDLASFQNDRQLRKLLGWTRRPKSRAPASRNTGSARAATGLPGAKSGSGSCS